MTDHRPVPPVFDPYDDANQFCASGSTVLRRQPDGTFAYLPQEEAEEVLKAQYGRQGARQRKALGGTA